jgi:serine/threonine-protein kinase
VLVVVGVAGAGFWLYAPVADKPKEIPSARLDPSLAAPPAQAPAPAPGDDATLAPSPQPGPALAPASAASPAPVATPPEPAPVQQAAAQAGPAQPDLRRRILTYLRDYAGGDCAIILPALVTSSSAEVDGYGSDVKPFELFDEAFKKSNGLEARVGVRLIPPAQCPAIGFANRLQNRSENALKVSVASDRLAAGQALDGSVENAGGPLYLLIVDDEGKVHDASGQLRRDGDRATFRMKLDRPRGTPARGPILLMAVAGADIAALKGLAGAPGAAAFRDALAQAKSSPDIAVGFRQVALE